MKQNYPENQSPKKIPYILQPIESKFYVSHFLPFEIAKPIKESAVP